MLSPPPSLLHFGTLRSILYATKDKGPTGPFVFGGAEVIALSANFERSQLATHRVLLRIVIGGGGSAWGRVGP